MKTATRRKLETGVRVLNFSRARPHQSPGYATALAQLEERLARAAQLAEQQRAGIRDVHTATQQKEKLRKLIRRSHLVHLAGVAEAATEVPELAQRFALEPRPAPYMAFRTAAGGIAAEAQSQKEVLVKHGLADSVLDNLIQALAQFDKAVELGTDGRRTHVGASAELDVVADDITHIIKVMNGLNRDRFAEDAESLAAWESASNTFGPVKAGGQADGRTAGQPVDSRKAVDGSKGEDHAA
jgi:hypothetical protein